MEPRPSEARVPVAFLIAVFAAAIVVGGLIAYLGISGAIGGAIP